MEKGKNYCHAQLRGVQTGPIIKFLFFFEAQLPFHSIYSQCSVEVYLDHSTLPPQTRHHAPENPFHSFSFPGKHTRLISPFKVAESLFQNLIEMEPSGMCLFCKGFSTSHHTLTSFYVVEHMHSFFAWQSNLCYERIMTCLPIFLFILTNLKMLNINNKIYHLNHFKGAVLCMKSVHAVVQVLAELFFIPLTQLIENKYPFFFPTPSHVPLTITTFGAQNLYYLKYSGSQIGQGTGSQELFFHTIGVKFRILCLAWVLPNHWSIFQALSKREFLQLSYQNCLVLWLASGLELVWP